MAEWDNRSIESDVGRLHRGARGAGGVAVCATCSPIPTSPRSSGRRPAVPDEWYDRMAEAAASSGMAAEVSSAGWRKPVAEAYPAPALLARFHKRDVPVTTASDAHELPDVAARARPTCGLLLADAGYESLAGVPRPPPCTRSPIVTMAIARRRSPGRTPRSRGPRSPTSSA